MTVPGHYYCIDLAWHAKYIYIYVSCLTYVGFILCVCFVNVVCSSLLKKRTLEKKDEDVNMKQKKKKKAKHSLYDGHGKDSKKLKKHKKHFVAQR